MSLFKKNNENKPTVIDRGAYESTDRHLKPFADFTRSDLLHLNKSQVEDYLKRPLQVKFVRKSREVAQTQNSGVFKVAKYKKSTPFHDTHFINVARRAKQMKRKDGGGVRIITHLSE